MIITFKGKINTFKANEKVVFKSLKEFMIDNFQDCEFEISGKNETLKHKIEKTNQ